MITRAERLADFTTDAGPALQALVEVHCEDHVGTYLLPFLCRLAPEGFRNARTGDISDTVFESKPNATTPSSILCVTVPSNPGLSSCNFLLTASTCFSDG